MSLPSSSDDQIQLCTTLLLAYCSLLSVVLCIIVINYCSHNLVNSKNDVQSMVCYTICMGLGAFHSMNDGYLTHNGTCNSIIHLHSAIAVGRRHLWLLVVISALQ